MSKDPHYFYLEFFCKRKQINGAIAGEGRMVMIFLMEETCLYDDRNQLSERKTIDNAGKGWTFP